MPIHYYFCEFCKTQKKRQSSFADIQEIITCPNCGKNMNKQLNVPAIHYRGSGFSTTDVKKPYDPFDKDDLARGTEKSESAKF